MLRFLRALTIIVLLTAVEAGCNKRHVAAPVPATPALAPAEPPTPPTPATPAASPAPSPSPSAPPTLSPSPQAPQQQPLQPAPTSPPRRSGEPNGSGQQPNQPPRLGDVLTPDQERQYNTAIDQSLARAQSSLGSIANRQLTKDQQTIVTQIQGFIKQAQTSRKSNLPAARSLAERADVLARDLAGSLR